MHELLLNPLHRQAGAALEPWRDVLVPARFSDPAREYRAVRTAVGLLDWSTTGVIEVMGADRVAFLHNLLTNDVKALRPGSGCHAALVSPTAKLLADLLVLADDAACWLLTDRARVEVVGQTLDHYRITEDVHVQDRSDRYAVLAVQGPTSVSFLQELTQTPLPRQSLEHRRLTLAALEVRMLVWSLTGEPGFLFVVLAEHAASLWEALLQRGGSHGLLPVGWEALNTLRIEAGIPWYGLDMDETNLLPETGLEAQAASSTKGCYVGQEVIARLESQGSVSRRLVGLRCDGDTVPKRDDPIRTDGRRVGIITSACVSPTLNAPIALGYVQRPFYAVGTQVEIVGATHTLMATVVQPPFLQPTASP